MNTTFVKRLLGPAIVIFFVLMSGCSGANQISPTPVISPTAMPSATSTLPAFTPSPTVSAPEKTPTSTIPAPQTNLIAETPSGAPGSEPISVNGDLQVVVRWTYQDEDRFAVEISIEHYPLPQGFQTRCPLTQLEVKNAGRSLLLYRNPDQMSLDEFYTISGHNRWYCAMEREGDGFADYLFSLTHFYGDETLPDLTKGSSLLVELGEVVAGNSLSVTTLPAVGTFELPLEIKPTEKNLTWLNLGSLTNKEISVQINRVVVNPSFALLDACLEYQDHHFWRPIAAISYQGQKVYSTEFLPTFPTFPYYPSDRASTLQSTRRCYSLIIPFDFPVDSLASFQIGIDQLQIVNTSPGVVTMQECEAVKETVEKSYTGLKIRCYEFETNGQPQHWFEVLSHPSDISAQEAYTLVESAFTQTIFGPWYAEIR